MLSHAKVWYEYFKKILAIFVINSRFKNETKKSRHETPVICVQPLRYLPFWPEEQIKKWAVFSHDGQNDYFFWKQEAVWLSKEKIFEDQNHGERICACATQSVWAFFESLAFLSMSNVVTYMTIVRGEVSAFTSYLLMHVWHMSCKLYPKKCFPMSSLLLKQLENHICWLTWTK